MREAEVIKRLRRIATAPGARGLLDDVAMLENFVVTHDTIAEGVHFLPSDPPASVGWKLVAVNLSDLAAKGATPAGALLSLTIAGPGEWELAFLDGIEAACESYSLPLVGGDTIALPVGAPRVLGMTLIGRAGPHVPERAGGQAGDILWLVGTVGDAAAGLTLLLADANTTGPLIDIYRRPIPQLGAGLALAPQAHAMMDVSDGLLIDARRMAEASGLNTLDRWDRTLRRSADERCNRRPFEQHDRVHFAPAVRGRDDRHGATRIGIAVLKSEGVDEAPADGGLRDGGFAGLNVGAQRLSRVECDG